MKVRELRTILRDFDKEDMVEILVEMYKTLPKALIEEKAIDEIIENLSGYRDARQREKEANKRVTEAYRKENVTPLAALQKWKAIPEYGRKLLLENVWCSHCGDIRSLNQYTVEPAANDIVLRGKCPVCHHEVARYVETE